MNLLNHFAIVKFTYYVGLNDNHNVHAIIQMYVVLFMLSYIYIYSYI